MDADTIRHMKTTFSPSSLKLYDTCPRQYQARYITNETPFTDTEATIYGKRMHAALEHAIDGTTPLPDEFRHLQRVVDTVRGYPGRINTEIELAVDHGGYAIPFNDPAATLRNILDYLA